MAKKNAGRSKTIMEKKADVGGRQVTFSKRRKGLEKKASELVTLTGSEVATVVFSPGGKVFSFGHPSVDTVIERFLGEEPVLEPGTQNREMIVQAHRELMQNQTNFHLNQINELVDAEWRRGEEIDRIRHETEGKVWWERPVEEMSEQQVESLNVMMQDFKRGVLEEARLLQQEQELSGGFPIPVPSNVMGGGADGGPALDPKGKGIANELPNSGVSFDPRVDGSISWGPLQYPTVQGFDDRVPSDPSTLRARTGFNSMSLGSSSQVPLDPMIHGFSDFGVPDVPILGGYDNQGPVDPNTGGSQPFNGMPVIRSSSQVPLDPMIHGFSDFDVPDVPILGGYDNQGPVDPNTGGSEPFNGMSAIRSSTQVPLDPMIHGFSDFGVPDVPILSGYDNQGPVDPNTGGSQPFNGMSVIRSSSQVPLDPSTLGFYGGASHPYDPMEAGSSGAVYFDQMGMGFDDDNGLSFNLNSFGFQDEESVDRNAHGPSDGGGN